MAIAMPSLCQRTVSVSSIKPTFKCFSGKPNGSTTFATKFITARCHQNNLKSGSRMMWSTETNNRKQEFQQKRRGPLRAVAEEDTQVEEQAVAASVVSRSDKLTMFFKAEGFLSNSKSEAKVTQILQNQEDVSDVKIETVESISTIELVKQTTIQATGVASGLVEQLQRMDFKLLNLSLRFEDEEEEEEEALREMLFKDISKKD